MWLDIAQGVFYKKGIGYMKASATVDAGICGFKTKITAETDDGMRVTLRMGSNCDTIKALADKVREKNPINAFDELSPKDESTVLAIFRPVLQTKGCCEACVVPAAMSKALQVAAGLALPKDVVIKITKES
ncbi:MAG: hypothetical protein DSY90_08930 [Deltaproteobacteria bacterium]|nr:MAG: hypothetical protein DSY90_08930 [Deltaproteobacteria bacterium]